MTQPARITEAEMRRATRAVHDAGFAHARIVMDLRRQRIEVIVGTAATPPAEEWSDDDI